MPEWLYRIYRTIGPEAILIGVIIVPLALGLTAIALSLAYAQGSWEREALGLVGTVLVFSLGLIMGVLLAVFKIDIKHGGWPRARVHL